MSLLLKKILLGIICLTFIISGGTYFYIKKKINPELVRTLIIKNIEKTLRNTKVTIEKVDYSIGFKVNFYLRNLAINLNYKKRMIPLTKIGVTQISIPVLSILMGGSKTKISIKSPEIFLEKIGKKTSWEMIIPSKKKTTHTKHKSRSAQVKKIEKIRIPKFLLNNSIGIEILNSKLDYKLGKNNKGIIELKKFIIKNLNFKSNTAYEIDSNFKLDISKDKHVGFNLLILGEFNIADFLINNKPCKVTSKIYLQNLTLPDGTSISNIETQLSAKIDQKLNVSAEFNTKLLKNVIEGKISVVKKIVKISDFNSWLYFDDLFSIFKINLPKYKSLTFNIKGSARLKDTKIKKLKFKWHFTPEIKIESCVGESKSNINGEISTKSLKISSKTNFLEGNIFSDILVNYNLNKMKIPLEIIKSINVSIKSNGINLKRNAVLKCYSNDSSGNKIKTKKKTNYTKYFAMVPLLPNTSIKLAFDRTKLGKHLVKLQSQVKVRNRTLNIKKFVFKNNDGFINFNGKSKISGKKLTSNFMMNIHQFNLNVLEVGLPKMLSKIGGKIDSKTKINSTVTNKISYTVSNTSTVKNFFIDGFDMSFIKTKIKKYLTKPKSLKDAANNFNPKSKFELLDSHMTLTPQRVKIKKLNIKNFSGRYNFTSNGYVDMLDMMGHSQLYLTVKDSKNSDFITQWKLKLMPDYKYTLSKYLMNEVNKKKKKLVAKVRKKAKKAAAKEIDKIKKKAGKKLKNMFKSLF